jgi:hypothetical protein
VVVLLVVLLVVVLLLLYCPPRPTSSIDIPSSHSLVAPPPPSPLRFRRLSQVPHTFVGGNNVNADYSSLKTALCTAGSTASVCNGLNVTSCSV